MSNDAQADHLVEETPELRAAIGKAARRLMPFLGLLYLINYLDRTNIAFAGPNGMNKELGLSASQFGLASGLFFLGYLILEVPSNIALHRFGARRWIARIMITWGIVATVMTWVWSPASLYSLRLILGIAEAGFFPGIILYLTYWFPQKDRARYTALFMAAVPISSALGSTLSSFIIQFFHNKIFGLEGWRAMFLLEGVPAIIVGIVCWFFLTDNPRAAKWLKPSEQEVLQAALDLEHEHKESTYQVSMGRALLMPRVWGLSLVYFGGVYGLYALAFFMPTIITGFKTQYHVNWSVAQIGLVTAIPYVLGVIAMVLWSNHSDRTSERVWHNVIPLTLGAILIPITSYMPGPISKMVMLSAVTICIMAFLPCFWALPTSFLTGAAAATGVALVNSIGNTSGFVGPYITGWLKDLTGTDRAGMYAIGVAMLLGAAITLLLRAAPATKAAKD